MRPEFEEYVARVAPQDGDDVGAGPSLVAQLPPQDAALLAALPAADVAASAREALARPDGYLRDAAVTFRSWEVRPEPVGCPTWLWYGELDANAPVRNGRWLAEHVPGATLVVREQTTHLATLSGTGTRSSPPCATQASRRRLYLSATTSREAAHDDTPRRGRCARRRSR